MCDHVSTNPTDFATKHIDHFPPYSPYILIYTPTIFHFLTRHTVFSRHFICSRSRLYASVHNDSQKIAGIRRNSQKTFSVRNRRIPFRTCSVPVQDTLYSVQTSLQTRFLWVSF